MPAEFKDGSAPSDGMAIAVVAARATNARTGQAMKRRDLLKIPRILLFDPFLGVAMQKHVTGYRYWFHRQLDYRQLVKT